MKRLLPCPFCGSTDVGVTYTEKSCSVKCFHSDCQGRSFGAASEYDAVKRWNRRVSTVKVHPESGYAETGGDCSHMVACFDPQKPKSQVGDLISLPTSHDPLAAIDAWRKEEKCLQPT